VKKTNLGDTTPTDDERDRAVRHPARTFRNYLIAGLLIWIPIMVTVWVIRFVARILDQSLLLLPPSWRPEAIVGTYVPGVGILLSLLLLFLTGVLVRNLFGRQIVAGAENLMRRIHDRQGKNGAQHGRLEEEISGQHARDQ
jgi:hypothetical protein